MVRKLQGISFKRFGVCTPRIGESDFDLPDNAAMKTCDTGYAKGNINRFPADWQGLKPTQGSAATVDMPIVTAGTTQGGRIFLNGEDNFALDKI